MQLPALMSNSDIVVVASLDIDAAALTSVVDGEQKSLSR